MAKNYETFLKETLLSGLEELQGNPAALEVAGIPRSSFEIFVKIFRNGLPPEIQQSLPAHNLADKEYLRRLTFQVENILQKPAPEAEKIFSNLPPLANLELAYQKAHARQIGALTQHQSWQTAFNQQIKQYNLDLARRLDLQLQKEFPSLADNPAKRKILVADMAQTIQNQGLKDIKGDYQIQAQAVVEKLVQTTIKHYATELEEASTEEKISAVSQAIAKEEAEPAFIIRQNQIRAEAPPGANPVYKIKTVIETSVLVNLPPELAADPQLVEAVTGEIMGRIHMASGSSEAEYQGYVAQQIRIILTQSKVAKILEQKKLDSAQIEKMAETVSMPLAEEISPEIYQVASSSSFAQTPFAGSVASFAPVGAAPAVQIIPPIPPTIPQTPIPPVPGAPAVNVIAPSVGIPGISGSGIGVVGYTAKDTPMELFQSEGSPLHFLSAMTSPRAAADLGKYLLTLGPVRSSFWFVWESFGLVKPDYMQIGLFSLDQMFSGLYVSLYGETLDGRAIFDKKGNQIMGLYEKLAAASGHEKYVLGRETKEAEKRFNFVKQFFDGIHNNPALDKTYKLFFGEQGKMGGFGIYHILHPWQSATSWLYNKNILAGLGVSGFFDSLSAYAKYGGYGGAYVSGEYVKMFGAYLIKVAGSKLGLYEVIGEGLRRRYVFKPLYRAQLWVQHGISAGVKAGAKAVAAQLSKTAAGKAVVAFATKAAIWLGTRIGTLLSGIASWIGIALLVWDLIKIAWAYFKKLLKWTAVAFAALMFWLFANFSLLEIVLSMIGGIPWAIGLWPLLQIFLGPFALPVGWMIGTFDTALIIKGAKGLFGIKGPLELVPGNLFSSLTNFAGNLVHGLTTGISSGLVGMVAPVLTITGGILGVGYFYMTMVTSSAFWLPSQVPQIQSAYFEVKKSASFSGKIGEPIKYTLLVNVKADKKDAKLVNIKISDKTDSSCQGQPPTISERNFLDKVPASLTLASPLTIDYSVPTDNSFNDCLITNTATVTADVENGPTQEESFYTASVTIGNPPVEAPSGWPITKGCISQGPGGLFSHVAGGKNVEALDIADPSGTPVLATHKGAVTTVTRFHPLYGNYVVVAGLAPSGAFSTLYAHLQTINVARGQAVKKGDLLGNSGNTGNSTNPHLHYEFLNLKMGLPYLPVSVPACSGSGPVICPNICW